MGEDRCSWLCGPHLRRCVLEKWHGKDDCMCDDARCAALREAENARNDRRREDRQ